MKKTISIFTALTTILWLSGVAMLAPISVQAADIINGDVVREADEFDVYIIKLVGDKKFKRLVLNPDVFNMYGHLEWSNVEVVADGTLDAYTTSTTVRADGDDKVYQLYPDGDVGTKKWVDSIDCFTSQGLDWDGVYVINTFDRDSYTTAATTLCEEGVVAGDITLSLASDTPEASNLPYTAEGVPYLKINVDGSGTISQMVIKRTGVGEPDDFSNVYLYEGDTRLTSGRSISSSTSKATFVGLSITAPTTITVVGDLTGSTSTAEAGNVNAFSLVSASDVTSDATVGGTFPINGNEMTITAVAGGTLTVALTGSVANPTVGEQDALLTQFKITADNEIIKLERFTIYNGGSISSAKMTNLELKTGGEIVATADTFNSDDLATFVFDPAYEMEKGTTDIFKMYADVSGDKDDTIKLYCEVDADVTGIGQTYGQNVAVTSTAFDGTTAGTDYHSLTLQGGELTIAFNGPVADNISEKTDDTVLLDLAFTAASDVEVRNLTAYLCWNRAADSETMANAQGEIDNIKIRDKDTGVVLMGPTDGSSFTAVENGSLAVCNETTYEGEMYKNWTDAWDLSAGETRNIQLTMDMATSATADADIDTSDGFVGLLRGIANLTNPLKYQGTNDYVASADVVPSTDITGNLMTIKGSSIDVALGSVPVGNVDGVKGQKGVTAMALIFTAGDASTMELTDLLLTAYVGDVSGAYTIGLDTGGPYAKDVVTNVSLYEDDGTTLIAGPKGFSGGTNSSDVTFDDLSWDIAAGESKKMLVKVDITTTATSGSSDYDYVLVKVDITTTATSGSSDYDYVAFDIMDKTDITAIDSEGSSSNSASEDINGTIASSPTVVVRKSDGGTLAVAATVAGVRPEQTFVYQGQEGVLFSTFKITSTLEAFKVDKFTIETEVADIGNMTKVELEYPIDADGTMVSTKPAGYFAGTASITFDLTGKEIYVPKDDYVYVNVYADLSTYADLGDQSLDDWSLDFNGDDADSNDFHAIGEGSSKVQDEDNVTSVDGVDMYLYRTFPTFTLDNSTGATKSSMSAINKILEFTITNNGDYDLVFNTASGELIFDVLGSGAATGNATFKLYKSDETEVSSCTVTNAGAGTASADFTTFSSAITIPKNGSQAMYVQIDSGNSLWDEKGDWLQLKLLNEVGGNAVIKWDDGNAGDLDPIWVLNTKDIGIPISGPVWNISW